VSVLDAIGNTSMVQLRRVVPPDCARILVKLEWENPTGSMKDRMALGVITRAEEQGKLKAGGTVVEYTGGSTGASLALVCAARGYRIRIVTSDAFSREKRDQMAAFGAELTLIPSEGGFSTKKLFLEMIETARAISREPGTYWVNQLEKAPRRKIWHNYRETRLTFDKSYLARLNYTHQNPVKHGLVPVASQYPWCSAAWFERTATPAQIKTIYSFKTDRLDVPDNYTPAREW